MFTNQDSEYLCAKQNAYVNPNMPVIPQSDIKWIKKIVKHDVSLVCISRIFKRFYTICKVNFIYRSIQRAQLQYFEYPDLHKFKELTVLYNNFKMFKHMCIDREMFTDQNLNPTAYTGVYFGTTTTWAFRLIILKSIIKHDRFKFMNAIYNKYTKTVRMNICKYMGYCKHRNFDKYDKLFQFSKQELFDITTQSIKLLNINLVRMLVEKKNVKKKHLLLEDCCSNIYRFEEEEERGLKIIKILVNNGACRFKLPLKLIMRRKVVMGKTYRRVNNESKEDHRHRIFTSKIVDYLLKKKPKGWLDIVDNCGLSSSDAKRLIVKYIKNKY